MQKYIEKNEYPNENIEITICLTSFNIEQNEYLDILSYICMVNKYIYMDILKIIQQHGESLTSLADKLGVTQPTLSNNIKRPSYSTLERIAAALQVEPWELLAPPSIVEELKQARAQQGCERGLVGVVRIGCEIYTADSVKQLRAIVERLEQAKKNE